MKKRFTYQICPHCRSCYDAMRSRCPSCNTPSSDPATAGFDHFLLLPWGRQLALFLAGWMGFQFIAAIVASIFQISYAWMNPGFTPEMLNQYLTSVDYAGPVHFVAYSSLFLALTLILWKENLEVLRSFKRIKPLLWGLAGIAMIYGFQMVYGNLLQLILNALGQKPQENANENALNIIVKAYPVAAIFIFGIVAPYCEEVTYRIGLFSFFGRLGKWEAYVFSAIVFGLIHFDWTCFGNQGALLVELYNIPIYIGAGLILGFIYDRGGFGASFITHAANNLISTVATLLME